MKKYTKKELKQILDNHLKWLKNEDGGIKANLRFANLISADLRSANLRFADLSFADLRSANLRFADLRFANLRSANLRFADLSFADLRSANLRFADLRFANLRSANLRFADLRFANLISADLRSANLRSANLISADLRSADLRSADLRFADLRFADLRFANLISANLISADLVDKIIISYTSILPEGDLIGWKKCKNNVIVKLKIHAESKRSNSTGRKCRAEFVEVLKVFNGEYGISNHDGFTIYSKGDFVTCDKFDENRWEECSTGIHFFITRLEAENY